MSNSATFLIRRTFATEPCRHGSTCGQGAWLATCGKSFPTCGVCVYVGGDWRGHLAECTARLQEAAAGDRSPRQQRPVAGALPGRLPPRHRAGRRLHRVRHQRHERPEVDLSARELAGRCHRLGAGVRRPTETDALRPFVRHERHRPLQLRLHAAGAPSVETPPAPVQQPRPRVQRPFQDPHVRRVRGARQVCQQNRRHLSRD